MRSDLENKANSWPNHQAYLEHALEQAQTTLNQMQPVQHAASSSTEVVDAKNDKDGAEDKVAKLQAQLDNLRLVNVALVTRLKAQESAPNATPKVEEQGHEESNNKSAKPKRAVKKQ